MSNEAVLVPVTATATPREEALTLAWERYSEWCAWMGAATRPDALVVDMRRVVRLERLVHEASVAACRLGVPEQLRPHVSELRMAGVHRALKKVDSGE